MTTTAALELVQLTKKYGAVTAVDAINLKIPAGSYCCLLGPSGCGKTSTLRMVAGHESATSGDILVGPKNVTDLPPAERNTAMMFQSYALFPHLSVIDNVAFALKMKGIVKATRHAEAKKLLELVDMQAYAARLPAQLSGGQQQRVAIARTLAIEPRILLMDEPFSALDEPTRLEMQELLVNLWHRLQPTILCVTHSVAEAVYLAERLWIFTKAPGQIAYDIRDSIPPSVGITPLEAQDRPEFKRVTTAVTEAFRGVLDNGGMKHDVSTS